MPHTAYIVAAKRTAGGKRNGNLSGWHPADLGATVIDAMLDETGIDPGVVDDVIFGCVCQNGAQAGNIGRSVVLSSKLPQSVPGVSVDRQCGSSQQSIHFAAQAVMSGVQDVVIAGGVEVMSLVPIGSNIMDGKDKDRGFPNGEKINEKYGAELERRGMPMFSQFEGAEIMCEKYGVTRPEMEEFALASHQKAVVAQKEGRFDREVVVLTGKNRKGESLPPHSTDQGVRPNVTIEQMSKMKTLKKGGLVTAALASQICDGAAALMIMNEAGLKKTGLRPRAKIVELALAGSDPVIMLDGPIPATQNAFKRSGLTMKDMDLYEVNEAFAPVPLGWAKECGADLSKLNVNGGAMALGHPLGGTGAKIMTTLLHEMERRGARYGLQAICEGGGTANATIIELCPPNAKL